MNENTMPELVKFFSTEENPLKTPEFMTFWKSLDEEEKAYYKSADLT